MAHSANRRARPTPTVQKKTTRFVEPKKEKRVVKTNVIFKNSHDRMKKYKRPDLGKSVLSSRRHRSPSPAPKDRSLASESNSVLNEYREKVTATADKNLNRAYKDLIKRLENSTLRPNSLSNRIAQAAESGQYITKPLADETVKVRFKDSRGNITLGQIPIGKTVSVFENKLKEKQIGLESLWEEWSQVRQEIAEEGARLLHDPTLPTKFGLDAKNSGSFPVSLDPVYKEIQKIRNEMQLESERARGEVQSEAEECARERKLIRARWLQLMNDELV